MFYEYKDAATGKKLIKSIKDDFKLYYLTKDKRYKQYDNIVNHVDKYWKTKIYKTLNTIPKTLKILKPGETDIDLKMPTLWLETSDAYDMALQNDFSGIDSVLKELQNWIKKKGYVRR